MLVLHYRSLAPQDCCASLKEAPEMLGGLGVFTETGKRLSIGRASVCRALAA